MIQSVPTSQPTGSPEATYGLLPAKASSPVGMAEDQRVNLTITREMASFAKSVAAGCGLFGVNAGILRVLGDARKLWGQRGLPTANDTARAEAMREKLKTAHDLSITIEKSGGPYQESVRLTAIIRNLLMELGG